MLQHLVWIHGIPTDIVSDQGPQINGIGRLFGLCFGLLSVCLMVFTARPMASLNALTRTWRSIWCSGQPSCWSQFLICAELGHNLSALWMPVWILASIAFLPRDMGWCAICWELCSQMQKDMELGVGCSTAHLHSDLTTGQQKEKACPPFQTRATRLALNQDLLLQSQKPRDRRLMASVCLCLRDGKMEILQMFLMWVWNESVGVKLTPRLVTTVDREMDWPLREGHTVCCWHWNVDWVCRSP